MIAKNLLTSNFDEEALIADDYVKQVEPRANYMILSKSNTLILYPSYINQNEIEYGLKYGYFVVDGKLYKSIYTSPMNELKRLFKVKKNIQLTLF